ncbi:MAG: hypothetical protein V4585_02210 [Bacteroidota bacterium]
MSDILANKLLHETYFIEESLYKKLGDLSELEQEVVDSLHSGDILAENT